MYDWAWITNDPMLVYRIGLMEDAIVFCFGMIAIWLILFEIGKRYNISYWDTWATKYGFKDYEELRFSFTRIMYGTAVVFLAGVCMVYFFTHITEVKNIYLCAGLIDTVKECEEKKGFLACETIGASGLNFSRDFLNVTWRGVEHNGINESRYPNHD